MTVKVAIVTCDAVPQGTIIAMREDYPVFVGDAHDIPNIDIDEMFLHSSDVSHIRDALKERYGEDTTPDAIHVCNETYQVVSALADMADVFDDPAVTAVLDNLNDAASGQPLTHQTVLPFYPAGWQEKIAIITEDEVNAAAKWLCADDSAYEHDPDRGRRAARAMLNAAKLARWGQDEEPASDDQ